MNLLTKEYSWEDMRGLIHIGTFATIPSKDFQIGDWFLSNSICKYTKVPVLMKICDIKPAYTFNNEPIYRFTTRIGSSYISNLKHVSCYDQIKEGTDFTGEFK